MLNVRSMDPKMNVKTFRSDVIVDVRDVNNLCFINDQIVGFMTFL